MILLHYYHTKLLLYYIKYVCSLTANHSNGHPLSISSNRNLSYAITVKSKGGIYHTINCTAISSHLLFIYRAKTCSASLNSKISYLTLYLGIETISMQWMDMDWNLKTVSPTFSSLILCLKNPPHPRKKKKYIYIYIIMVSAPDKICFISSWQLYTSINFCVWVLKGAK